MSRTRIWNPEQIKILKERYEQMPTKELVEIINDPKIGISQVNSKAGELGLKKSAKTLARSYFKNIQAINTRKKKSAVITAFMDIPKKEIFNLTDEDEEMSQEEYERIFYSDIDKESSTEDNVHVNFGERY